MGGRRTQIEEDDEPPVRNTRGASQQNRRSNDDDDEENSQQQKQSKAGELPPLGGEGRTIYRLHGDGMGGRKVPVEETPAKAAPTISAAKRAELGYRDDEADDFHYSKKEVEQLAGGNKTIYRTQGDGMGGRKVVSEEPQSRAPQMISAAKRAELGYNDEEEDLSNKMGKVELLGGGERTIYRTQGDGMGGRKAAVEEEAPKAQAPREISAAKRAELGYADEAEEKNTKEVEQLGGGSRTIYRTQGDGMGGRKVVAEEPSPVASRGISAAKRAELGHDREEQEPTGKVDLLGGGGRTIYKTSGDGMGGRKGASSSFWGHDEEEPEPPRGNQRGVRKDTQSSSHWDF